MLILLELNELNFEQVRAYGGRGELPVLNDLMDRHGVSETSSEVVNEELEPWIQWVTAHTGLTLAEHGVFRLGDILSRDIDQVWEVLERQGVNVGAISPMNAKNRCQNPAFFMPDPWTRTKVSGPAMLKRLYGPVAQAVNDNAAARITAGSALSLLCGMARYARPSSYPGFVQDVMGAIRGRPWRKAMTLDRLLADVFIRETRAGRPGFASLFLNAGAHIQHHYLFNSAVYEGPYVNPSWYVSADLDPVLDVYRLYDAIIEKVRSAFPDSRLMLATGLHQDAHAGVTLYWRLRDHAAFLSKIEVPFMRVEPRMSRDFVLVASNTVEASEAEQRLMRVTSPNGEPMFEVDNRGESLFVTFSWPHDIDESFTYYVDGRGMGQLRADVAFVAVKNGEHNGVGYFLDSACSPSQAGRFPLKELPTRIADACGRMWPGAKATGVARESVVAV